MEELEQQLEALEVVSEYSVKLIAGIENVTKEISGEKLPDTEDYLKHVIDGINWIIGVFNGTRDLINAETEVINKEAVNESVLALNAAMEAKDDLKIVSGLESLLVFVKTMKESAEKAVRKQKQAN